MTDQNTTENVFRFVQLRPAAPSDPAETFELIADTALVKELAAATTDARVKIADAYLRKNPPREVVEHLLSEKALEAWSEALESELTATEFRNQVPGQQRELTAIRIRTSDALLAGKFATDGLRVAGLADLFRALSILVDESIPAENKIQAMSLWLIVLPPAFSLPSTSIAPPRKAVPAPAPAPNMLPAITNALSELSVLARSSALRVPSRAGEKVTGTLLSIKPEGMKHLSTETRAVFAKFGLDAEKQPIYRVASLLEAERAKVMQNIRIHGGVAFGPADPPEVLPYIKSVGVADLLVVKQHLTGYERTDIAHVENIMAHEKRSRNHRALERTEETFTTEKETTEERESELETAERFELNRESVRTAKRDQEFGFGLTLSGKYGPTVEFSSDVNATSSSSTEESSKSATTYAKDIMERSLERVVERVRTEQVRRVIREQEETNLHEFDNQTSDHVSGVYQFLEKVYQSQVFNYGIRQMFDFMVPEPASFVWHVEKTETKLSLPPPPVALETLAPNADRVNETNYLDLAAKFGADGIETPPPLFLTVTTSMAHGQEGSDDSEEGQPRGIVEKELAVPPGYRPFFATARTLALTDNSLTLAITLGNHTEVWKPAASQKTDVGSGHTVGHAELEFPVLGDTALDAQSRIPLHVLAFETNSYSLSVEMLCLREDLTLTAWKIKTYQKLQEAYRETMQRYEAKVAELKAQAEAEAARVNTRFGAPPSQNTKIVKAELKKHCISIVTRQRFEDVSAVEDGDPPYFEFAEAAEKGLFTRFFEQAFEWDQMQYVFYPYFWARKDTWSSRFTRDDVDPSFLEFMQAGAARVVVPVRPGFELAVTHYLETKRIWNGEGEAPTIHSDLYVPIVREIQERTGAPSGEVPVGDPWTTRLPTPLVILRREESLPKWERTDLDGWEWEEEEA